jgi:hypothetical protein
MLPRATREQRVEWHAVHVKACACRAIPESIGLDVQKLIEHRPKQSNA